MDFQCPECQSKTVFAESESDDVKTTSTFVCPSCQTLYDVGGDNTTTKSKFDKTNYRNKIEGITNQLAYTRSTTYTVPCPHCKHIYEMKGIPIKSVHWCKKCYQYFGIDDVKVTFFTKERQFKHGFQVSPIYPPSLFYHDIDKLADWWGRQGSGSGSGSKANQHE